MSVKKKCMKCGDPFSPEEQFGRWECFQHALKHEGAVAFPCCDGLVRTKPFYPFNGCVPSDHVEKDEYAVAGLKIDPELSESDAKFMKLKEAIEIGVLKKAVQDSRLDMLGNVSVEVYPFDLNLRNMIRDHAKPID